MLRNFAAGLRFYKIRFYKIKKPKHTIVLYRVVLYLVETNLVETKACQFRHVASKECPCSLSMRGFCRVILLRLLPLIYIPGYGMAHRHIVPGLLTVAAEV